MTAMSPLRPILNDDPADATDVDWNFQSIAAYISTDVITRDGATAMTAPLTLSGAAPTSPAHAAPKSYVDSLLPIGSMMPFAGSAVGGGWAFCDGQVKTTTDPEYAALFGVIGTKYNKGDEGPGNFRLPDTRGTFLVSRDASVPAYDTLGDRGGSRDAVVVSHDHSIAHDHGAFATGSDGGHEHTIAVGSGPADRNHRHGIPAGQYVFSETQAVGGSGVFPLSGSPTKAASSKDAFLDDGSNHTHSINGATTGGGVHAHTIDVPSLAGQSGPAAGGVAGANANLPPFLTVTYIIRIG